MGQRHKRAETAGIGEQRLLAPLTRGGKTELDSRNGCNWGGDFEPVLPSLPNVSLSFRRLGSFRGRKIWETGLGVLRLH